MSLVTLALDIFYKYVVQNLINAIADTSRYVFTLTGTTSSSDVDQCSSSESEAPVANWLLPFDNEDDENYKIYAEHVATLIETPWRRENECCAKYHTPCLDRHEYCCSNEDVGEVEPPLKHDFQQSDVHDPNAKPEQRNQRKSVSSDKYYHKEKDDGIVIFEVGSGAGSDENLNKVLREDGHVRQELSENFLKSIERAKNLITSVHAKKPGAQELFFKEVQYLNENIDDFETCCQMNELSIFPTTVNQKNIRLAQTAANGFIKILLECSRSLSNHQQTDTPNFNGSHLHSDTSTQLQKEVKLWIQNINHSDNHAKASIV